ncbi:MAG TPA: peptide-methionine (S)-S-oxide reductase MsrA [Gemmatimonadales bacterium]|nr:peptide-methionine (S)-S-oxide reductase MsrA [Gemmatimonadales bacterium]
MRSLFQAQWIRVSGWLGLTVCALASGATAQAPAPKGPATAIFAGGCFWSMEHPFDQLPGVLSVTVGYTGGHARNPTYAQVSSGRTGHAESVQVEYDPAKIDYATLLQAYWHNIDPLTPDAEFCDHGTQYRSAIFYLDDQQKQLAEQSKQALQASGRFKTPIVTQIVPASQFYPAEEYHQHYYRKNAVQYQLYRQGCGRDARLKELWGDSAARVEAIR